MKMTRRLIALVVTLLMLVPCVASLSFAEGYEFKTVGTLQNINDDVTYQRYTLTSGENGTTVDAVAMNFDTNDGYLPMVFMGYAGTSGTLATQTDIAIKKYGYEVVGAINGAFFGMDNAGNGQYGTLVDYVISNGKVMSAHAGDACEVVAFASDGTFQVVNSMIDYQLYINGESLGSLYYINKTSGTKNAGNWTNGFYYFDTSCGRVTDTNPNVMGYNVLCKKLDHTDLIVGGTLKGEVISVTETADGAQVSDGYDDVSDKFDIFVKSTSPNAKYVKDLKAGDSVNITVTETVEASREIIENANSVIENVGWLVKDGVDQTQIQSTIGTHSVTLKARWTAFGRKADGSYVFFTTDSTVSDGGSYSTGNSPCATLRDVAKAMISLGCVDVIRMDGGGSTAMYAASVEGGDAGYLMATQGYIRPVADCILVVKKSSAEDPVVTQALRDAAAAAKEGENIEAAVQEVLDEIDGFLFQNEHPCLSDARRLLMKLSSAASGKNDLNAALANAVGVQYTDYSMEVLDKIRETYDTALAVFGDAAATAAQVKEATDELNYWLGLKGDQDLSLSRGASYVVDQGVPYDNPTYADIIADDGVRLTDGQKGNVELMSPLYSAYTKGSATKPIITIDLGEVTEANTFKAYTGGGGEWGISSPRSILVEYSADGNTFAEAGTATYASNAEVYTDGTTWDSEVFTLKLEENVKARYVRFTLTTTGNFAWIEELEVCKAVQTIQQAVYINGFNRMVYSNDSCLFNSEVGNLKENDGAVNAKWTQNVFLKWDPTVNMYRVTKNTFGNGSAPNVTLAEDELLLAVHGDSGSTGFANREMARKTLKLGTCVKLFGVNVEDAKLGIAPFAMAMPEPEPEPDPLPLGDVNGDGERNAKDYIMLKRHILGSLSEPLSDAALARCDINGDNAVNAKDYIFLKRWIIGTWTPD